MAPDLSDNEIDRICDGLTQPAAKVRYLRLLDKRCGTFQGKIMTIEQPEALRLANVIKASGQFTDLLSLDAAAAELQRLHTEIETLRTGYAAARLEIASLQAQAWQCGAGAGCCAQAARIEELEAQLEAVGAGGVGPLVGNGALANEGTMPAAQVQKDAKDAAMESEPDQPESMPLTKDEIVSMAIEANPCGIDGRLTEVALSTPSTLLRFAALVTAAERRACTAACEKVKQQVKATANSSFVTDAGKDIYNAMAAGAHNCIAAIAARGSNGH